MTSNEPHGIGALNVIPGIDGGEFRPPRIEWPASRAGSAGTSDEILTVPAAEDLRAPSGLPHRSALAAQGPKSTNEVISVAALSPEQQEQQSARWPSRL